MRSGANQTGLSLLEMLVVFVIISLVSTVLAQGFGFGLALYERVESRGQQMVADVLSVKWFRHVNGSLIASKQPGTSPDYSLVAKIDLKIRSLVSRF